MDSLICKDQSYDIALAEEKSYTISGYTEYQCYIKAGKTSSSVISSSELSYTFGAPIEYIRVNQISFPSSMWTPIWDYDGILIISTESKLIYQQSNASCSIYTTDGTRYSGIYYLNVYIVFNFTSYILSVYVNGSISYTDGAKSLDSKPSNLLRAQVAVNFSYKYLG